MQSVATNVLLVEPEISAQLALLDAVHAARAQADVDCVATCGGARHALESGSYDALLLSTNLGFFDTERQQLHSLSDLARTLGLTVLSITPPGLRLIRDVLGLSLDEAVSHEEVLEGRLDAVLERARSVRDSMTPPVCKTSS